MKTLKKRYMMLSLSAVLLGAYVNQQTPLNPATVVYAQIDLPEATFTEPASVEDMGEMGLFRSFLTRGHAQRRMNGRFILTRDVADQAGGIYLSEKFDFNYPFSISGQINLGDKFSPQHSNDALKGGDGISFIFLDAYVGKFGQAGSSLGLGGMKNSFGFKLDTHHNAELPSSASYADNDPFLFGGSSKIFGGFIYTNYRGHVVTTDAKVLENTPDNTFVPFSLTYGGKADPTLSLTYGGTTLTKRLDSRFHKEDILTRAFGIFASTIDGTNEQQIQLESVRYTALNPKIVVRYINDLTGEPVRSPRDFRGQLGSTKEMIGTDVMVAKHRMVRSNIATAAGFQSENHVKFLNGTQTITYTYLPIENDSETTSTTHDYSTHSSSEVNSTTSTSVTSEASETTTKIAEEAPTSVTSETSETTTKIAEETPTSVTSETSETTTKIAEEAPTSVTSETSETTTKIAEETPTSVTNESSETTTVSKELPISVVKGMGNESTSNHSSVSDNRVAHNDEKSSEPVKTIISSESKNNNSDVHKDFEQGNKKDTSSKLHDDVKSDKSHGDNKKKKDTLPNTGEVKTGNIIYQILAFIGAGLVLLLAHVKRLNRK